MKITFSIFPKFFRSLTLEDLIEMTKEVGLDTANLVVREGYWCEPKSLAKDAARYVRAFERAGMAVRFATAGYMLSDLAAQPDALHILADNGIREFRMGYFRFWGQDVHQALYEARTEMAAVVEHCERAGIRAVYQVHHTMLISNASAAWWLVQGLPSKYVGVELDPGNQSFEGTEDGTKSVGLLGDYLTAYGIKDSRAVRDPARTLESSKGWSREWCGLPDGDVNWHDVVRPLARQNWTGTFVFMPFYHETDVIRQREVLRQEVAYLRSVCAREQAAAVAPQQK